MAKCFVPRKFKYSISDYVGKQFNDWTVISQADRHPSKTRDQRWNCRCKCGHEQPVRVHILMNGDSKRCKRCSPATQSGSDSPLWNGSNLISGAIVCKYKHSAAKRRIPFEISAQDMEDLWIKQGGTCIYTGEKLTLPAYTKDNSYTASLDRIDSSKGYTRDNIQWVTKNVNIMKMAVPHEEFVRICKQVAQNYKGGTCVI